jgi:hypothetical protein
LKPNLGVRLYWYLRQLLGGGIGNVLLITKTASKKEKSAVHVLLHTRCMYVTRKLCGGQKVLSKT